MLLRFYEKTSGSILLDDDELNDLSEESICSLMTVIQQNVYVFDDTLRANITLHQRFTEAEINEAIKLSGLSEFVTGGEQGLETMCGENGINLSGGQKQRLCIARALIRKTPILLLDEATSSLDSQVTAEIEKSILDIDSLTVMIVTHKLNETILKKYDRILFMKNGKIIESGNFENLFAKGGEFYKLFRLSL